MPSYWIVPQSDIELPLPAEQHGDLSECFYGLIGAGYTALFDQFPPVFTQLQRLADVDIDSLLPLYVSMRMNEHHELPHAIDRVAKDITVVEQRFASLYKVLLSNPGWVDGLALPKQGYGPRRVYFEHFCGRPKPVREQWEIDAFGEPDESNSEPLFGDDLRYLLRYLQHAIRHGATRFWFLGR